MIGVDRDTLRYWKANPFLKPSNRWSKLSTVDVATAIAASSAYQTGNFNVLKDASTFYMANHAWSLLGQKFHVDEPLGEYIELAKMYSEISADVLVRVAYYLTLICTRESRHMHESNDHFKEIKSLFGQEFLDFHKRIRGNSSIGAVSRFFSSSPEVDFGTYVEALEHMFFSYGWSSGYGGEKWGEIAKVLRRMVQGETSPEVLVDTSFTLAHNGGQIFNKDVIYQTPESDELQRLLDCQRAGMVPQLVNVSEHWDATDEEKRVFDTIEKYFPDEVAGDVSWNRVMELGAIGDYSYWASKQEEESPTQVSGKKVWVTDSEYAVVVNRLGEVA